MRKRRHDDSSQNSEVALSSQVKRAVNPRSTRSHSRSTDKGISDEAKKNQFSAPDSKSAASRPSRGQFSLKHAREEPATEQNLVNQSRDSPRPPMQPCPVHCHGAMEDMDSISSTNTTKRNVEGRPSLIILQTQCLEAILQNLTPISRSPSAPPVLLAEERLALRKLGLQLMALTAPDDGENSGFPLSYAGAEHAGVDMVSASEEEREERRGEASKAFAPLCGRGIAIDESSTYNGLSSTDNGAQRSGNRPSRLSSSSSIPAASLSSPSLSLKRPSSVMRAFRYKCGPCPKHASYDLPRTIKGNPGGITRAGKPPDDGLLVLPESVWQHAFSFVPAQDLLSVMLTARLFCSMAEPFKGFYFHWNLRAAESLQSLRPYISKLRHLNAKMRAILLDWVTDVHQSLSFAPATLYRTAQVLDQFLSRTENVTREKLQLVGVTAFMVAAKGVEHTPPDPDDCAYWTDNAYSGLEVSSMEARLLKVLSQSPFRPPSLPPTAQDFLTLYLKEVGAGKLASCRAQYYCERTLQEHDMLSFPPSLIAAASVILALKSSPIPVVVHPCSTQKPKSWTEAVAHYSGYSDTKVAACARRICQHVRHTVTTLSGRKLDAVKRKYANGLFLAVSRMEPPTWGGGPGEDAEKAEGGGGQEEGGEISNAEGGNAPGGDEVDVEEAGEEGNGDGGMGGDVESGLEV